MKHLLYFACSATLFAAAIFPCFAVASPWDGTWKLNPSRSKMTGEVFTITVLPSGGFHLNHGNGSFEFDYTCDGKDYVVHQHITGTCVKLDDHHYKMSGKLDGKTVWEGTSDVSADDHFLTNTAIEHRPDGTPSIVRNRFERIGTGTGRAGAWRNVQTSESAPGIMKLTLNGDTLRIDAPAFKSVTLAKLDGSPAHLEGPGTPQGLDIRIKSETPLKLHITSAYNGKPISDGYQTVTADGKTLTKITWDPSKPAARQTYIYERQ